MLYYQFFSICKIWIWVPMIKGFRGLTIPQIIHTSTEFIVENRFGVNAGNGMHSIIYESKIGP